MVASLMPGWGGKQCKLSGFLMGCGQVARLVESGLAAPGSDPNVLPIYSRSLGQYVGLAVYNAQAAANGIAILGAGSLGYLPVGSTYKQGDAIYFQSWFGSLFDGGNRFGSYEAPSNFISERAAQIRSLPFIGQTAPQNSGIQGNPQFNAELEDFLKKYKTCLEKVQALGRKLGEDDYKKVLSQTPIYDGSDSKVYNAKGFNGDPNRSLRDYAREHDSALGVTVKEGIYLTATTVWRSVAERSLTLFHESLHRYFFDKNPDHPWLAEQFGIRLINLDRKDPKYAKMTDKDFKDYRASLSLDRWIKNGCK